MAFEYYRIRHRTLKRRCLDVVTISKR